MESFDPDVLRAINQPPPPQLAEIERYASELGFDMSCDAETGSLLRWLAASRPSGRVVELGTGVGVSTAWLLDGLGSGHVDSVESDSRFSDVAKRVLGRDPRLTLHVTDGEDFLHGLRPESVDLVFADTWPGKFWCLEPGLDAIKPGGVYVVDDLLPQPNWPVGHGEQVEALAKKLVSRDDFRFAFLKSTTGIAVGTKRL